MAILTPKLEERSTVRIGLLDYEVRRVDRLAAADDDGRYTRFYGRVHYGEQLIEIDEGLPPMRQRMVLWHEIVHALLDQAGFDEHDERLVTVLGYGIPAVLAANPWLGEEPTP